MTFSSCKLAIRIVLTAAVALLSVFWTVDGLLAQERSQSAYVMKIGIATINDTFHQFSKNFAAAVERDSSGRIKAEVYPGSQLGSIPRMIEGVQFGSIQGVVIPPEFFVGVDERFEVMAATGLVDSMEQAQRLVTDPAVLKLMLGLGANKGLYGAAMLTANPNELVATKPIGRFADFKGKRIRIFASQFQTIPFERLGATPVAMTLGDVVPALQQGAIDGALAGIPVLAAMHFKDAAKYVTHIGQPTIFGMVEVSRKWFDALPSDLQQIVEKDAAAEAIAINPWAIESVGKAFQAWTDSGGEVINLPSSEHSALLQTLTAAAEDVAQRKPSISSAYQVVKDAAGRLR
jgi:TRAP-type transport system periplasmic protein